MSIFHYLTDAMASSKNIPSYTIILNGVDYPYQVNHSKRASYVKLKLSEEKGITLVIPDGVSIKQAQTFLISKTAWLEKNVANLPPKIPFSESRPSLLTLTLLSEIWRIEYHATPMNSIDLQVVPSENKLHLIGCIDHKASVVKVLGQWLALKARGVLPLRLNELAEKYAFQYNRVSIRGQKTRWGSCSSEKNISLNYKLLFLNQAIVDYVLIHELCHTLEMNHSKRFWQLVSACDEGYQTHKRLLNQQGHLIPI